MNICLVNNLFPPMITGSSYYTNDLAVHPAKKGHKVVVLSNLMEGTETFEIRDNIRIYRLPVKKLPQLKLWMGFKYFNFTLTYKNLRKIKKIPIEEEIMVGLSLNDIVTGQFYHGVTTCGTILEAPACGKPLLHNIDKDFAGIPDLSDYSYFQTGEPVFLLSSFSSSGLSQYPETIKHYAGKNWYVFSKKNK